MTLLDKACKEMFEQSALASFLTGTMIGMIKYEDRIPEKVKQNMAHHIMWSYKMSKVEMTESTITFLKEVLGEKEVEEYLASKEV